MQWESIDESTVKLTQDQQYAADAVGAKLPFFPFVNDEEFKQFVRCALDNKFPLDDDKKAVLAWCKYVDGVNISSKLLVHIRQYCEAFQKN